mgnify:CR=1 FL=1
MKKKYNKWATLFGGWFGLHRYLSKEIGIGLIYTFTFGLFGIGWSFDVLDAFTGMRIKKTFFFICAWSFFSAFSIFHNYIHYSKSDWMVIFLVWLIPCIFCLIIEKMADASFTRQQEREQNKNAELLAQQNALAKEKEHRIAAIDTLSLAPIPEPKLLLKPSEIAYIEQPATLSITENKVVGTTGRSSGVSMRVAKGMYVRTGGSGGRKIYDDVTTTYDGILSITNQRVSFMQDRKAFEIRLDKLTNISYEDDALILQHGNKSYVLLTEDADIMEHLIRKLCSAKSSAGSISSI